MSSRVVSKLGTPSILDRFRAMVKEIEEEKIRVSVDDQVKVSLSTFDVVRLYKLVLSELRFNSKPVISDLTEIARENREHGRGIADAVCDWILEAADEQKLPALYLLDSIVKNIGREYVSYFAGRLSEIFCEAYRRVDSKMHPTMKRLLGTWGKVFPLSILGKIESYIQFSPSLKNQSLSGFDHGFGRVVSGRQDRSFETSAVYKFPNGVVSLDRPRTLIDAYGIDEREKSFNLNMDGIQKNESLKTWQDTEEEEFNWEDLTSAFRSKHDTTGNPGAPLVTSNSRSKLFNQVPLSVVKDSHKVNEDISAISSSPGVIDRINVGFHNEKTQHKPPCSFQNADEQIRDHLPPRMPGPASTGVYPPTNMHNRPRPLPSPQHQNIYQPTTVAHQSSNKSLQKLDAIGNTPQINVPQFSTLKSGLVPRNLQYPTEVNVLQQQQPLPLQKANQNIVPPTSVSASSQLGRPSLNHVYTPPQRHSVLSSVPITNSQFQFLGALPPMRIDPSPVSSQNLPISQNQGLIGTNPPAGGSLSGLLNSLMAQGVISLTKQTPSIPDPVTLEFNQDFLKVRHEYVIKALYADLPRQCTTCGLRFKCQEAHRTHMDWHVTKNRMSKTHKQKQSRNWFVNDIMWLSSAETLGSNAVPAFLTSKNAVESKASEEMAVPMDDNQSACALCGEHFEDFYSDETEEWMYKGAVYMNSPSVLMDDMDRSQLGPIVHANCRSETSGVSAEDHCGNERKRKRSPDMPNRVVKGKDSRVRITTY